MSKTLYEVITSAIKQEQSNIQTALPARVISFNGHTVTCEVMINKLTIEDKEIETPPLVDVVVQFPRAGGFCITVPIKEGDEGLVVFASRCIDGWYESGGKSKPLDSRTHDFSDGFFIPGVNSKPSKIEDFYHDGASMQTDDGETYIRLTEGKIYIKGDIEHEGNSEQTGNSKLVGNLGITGAFLQAGGEGEAAEFEGTIKAKKVLSQDVESGVILPKNNTNHK